MTVIDALAHPCSRAPPPVHGHNSIPSIPITWNINDNWPATFDATNITEPTFHWNYGNQPKLFNFHNYLYSRTFAVGVRYNFGQ